MRPIGIKLIAAGAVIVPAVTYLAFAGMKDGLVQYHLQVDTFVKDSHFRHERVRLAGKVAESGLTIGAGRLNATFALDGQTAHVPVVYNGVVPDLFKAGCEVVVEGKMDDAGTFRSDLMMTKCASKYEAKGHGNMDKARPQIATAEKARVMP
jgi:cytochrome c-type biogenesis protein CcmE